ncbi:MAG: ankyrin repeat domain-containing protein [Rickettsiaceae bacterium H1]|nr:ankyrin repeat domain-containing protein [Rickettsiaceae bacterium H1]
MESSLIKVAKVGDLEQVKILIQKGASNEDKSEALTQAAFFGHKDIVLFLIDNVTDVNGYDKHGQTALHCAAEAGHEDIIKILINNNKAGLKIRLRDSFFTALHLASYSGHKQTVQLLLDNEAEINDNNNNEKKTPLHLAARHAHADVVKVLINAGADVNIKDYNGKTAYDLAVNERIKALIQVAKVGDLEQVKILIQKGASNEDKSEALTQAAFFGHKDIVLFLIDNVTDVNGYDKHGQTALHCAAEAGHEDIIKILINNNKAGLKIRLRDSFFTALHLASYSGHKQTVQLLLDNEAEINDNNNNEKKTPLHLAARHAHADVVKVLINAGADVNIKDYNGKTAYDLAVNERIKALILFERHKGAKIAVPVAAVLAVGAIVVFVLNETTNLIGNKPFMENKIAIIVISCLAVAAAVVAVFGVVIDAIKAKTQISTVQSQRVENLQSGKFNLS